MDDGAADHLVGLRLPAISLQATNGDSIVLANRSGTVVVYAYPRTGVPGKPNPDGWDMIPGARGCTPQSCAFRDQHKELTSLGVAEVFGLSTQTTRYQRELVERLHLPFSILSDNQMCLTHELRLPTIEVSGEKLLKRLTMVIEAGRISKVFYPVFPPDRNAHDVVDFLSGNAQHRLPQSLSETADK